MTKKRSGTISQSVNFIDLAVFLIVLGIFSHSVYQLFYDWRGFQPEGMQSLQAGTSEDGSRKLASMAPTFSNIEFQCQDSVSQATQASKIRVSGPLCGVDQTKNQLIRTEVTNQTNQAKATVFTDTTNQRFLTDYIPVQAGDNQLSLKFIYHGGKILSKELVIQRN